MCSRRAQYLACHAAEGIPDISPEDFSSSIADDWAADSGGTGGVGEAGFVRSWFELADVSTDSLDGGEYAGWIRQLTQQVTTALSQPGADAGSVRSRRGRPPWRRRGWPRRRGLRRRCGGER